MKLDRIVQNEHFAPSFSNIGEGGSNVESNTSDISMPAFNEKSETSIEFDELVTIYFHFSNKSLGSLSALILSALIKNIFNVKSYL